MALVAVRLANNRRNLTSGLVPLFLLAGTRLPHKLTGWRCGLVAALLMIGILATSIYGVGTVVGLHGFRSLPQSIVVPAIVRDAAGWRDLSNVLADQPATFFTLDCSIAAQIRCYTGRPAYTSWGQYVIWGIPDFDDATAVSLDYLPEGFITARLQRAFQQVGIPQRFQYTPIVRSRQLARRYPRGALCAGQGMRPPRRA